jgi:hypothetical protein
MTTGYKSRKFFTEKIFIFLNSAFVTEKNKKSNSSIKAFPKNLTPEPKRIKFSSMFFLL